MSDPFATLNSYLTMAETVDLKASLKEIERILTEAQSPQALQAGLYGVLPKIQEALVVVQETLREPVPND